VNTFISFRLFSLITFGLGLSLLFGCNPELLDGQPVVVESIEPLGGPLAGGTLVTITGSGLKTVEKISFGSDKCTDMNIIDDTSVTCITPKKNSSVIVNVLVEGKANKSDTLIEGFAYRPAPTITSLSPTSGILAGGQELTINGTGFLDGAIVTIGPVLCSNVIVDSPIKIRCTTLPSLAGQKSVIVGNYDSQNSASAYFTYTAIPQVTTVSPSGGVLTGGTSVTLYGSGLETTSQVYFGGILCTSFVRISSYQATCITPPNLAGGAVDVQALNLDGQSSTTTSAYTYSAAPTITSLDIDGGSLAGGVRVLVTGTGFNPGATMTFGGLACTGVGYISPTLFQCITPGGVAGVVDVTITNSDGQLGTKTSAYTYRAAPTVASVSPLLGPVGGGTNITITGTGFILGATTLVKVGSGLCGSVVVVNSTTITCTTIASTAGLVMVRVTNIDNQYGYKTSAFTFQAPPVISTLSPSSGPQSGGTSVTITGTGFLTGVTVSIGGTPCTTVTLNSSSSITCVTPSSTSWGGVDVVVTNTDNQSGAKTGGFSYLPPAELSWDIGLASPTPPDPDDYGQQLDNVTHTYTLKNVGGLETSAVTVSVIGANSTMWETATDNCTGTVLAPDATCTVQVNFLASGATVGVYTAILQATAVTGGSKNNVMTGEVIP